MLAKIKQMESKHLEILEIDDLHSIKPTEEELNHDWISSFIDHLPAIRNNYAHGSQTVHATVLRTFEIVTDLINQLYEPQAIEYDLCSLYLPNVCATPKISDAKITSIKRLSESIFSPFPCYSV